ncbi:melanopsin-A-like [Oncorhynchus nerka]|uniref:melanopsin-A-like n=1 Tax=Oncorhynchus nerka TaxID=8023 RepID=UPI0031B802F6
MGVLLCVPTRDRYSSFMCSTRRSSLTSTSDPCKTGKCRFSSLYNSESGLTEAELSSRPASRQVSSDVTQLHPTFSQRSKVHCSLKTLTEPEDISISEVIGFTIVLPATLEDVRKEKSKDISGRVPSTCLNDAIPAIIVTSMEIP